MLLLVFYFVFVIASTVTAAAGPHHSGETRSAKAYLQLINVTKYPNARCLDGSPGAFYTNLNTDEPSSWVFMLQGGGECIAESDCKARSTTALGSSKKMKENYYFNYGIQDTGARNPHFNNASYVMISYCTGDLHMGSVTKPDSTTFDLHFSGSYIVEAVMDTLMTSQTYRLIEASTIVMAGSSAGGLGIVSLLDRVANQLRESGSNADIVGAPEGGFYFFNDNTYHGTNPPPGHFIPWGTDSFPLYYKLWHARVNDGCAAHYIDTPWRCLVANYSFPFIQTRIFFTEALTDRVVTRLHSGVPDQGPPFTRDEENFLHQWASTMKSSLQQVVRSSTAGVFAPACWTHTTFDSIWDNQTWTGIMLNGKPRLEYLKNWINGGNDNKIIDSCGLVLCNPTCPIFHKK